MMKILFYTLAFTALMPMPLLRGDIDAVSEEMARGDALYSQNRLRDSLSHYKKALVVSPEAGLYFKMGTAYMNLGEVPLAEEFFIQAIALNDGYASAYKALGEVYIERRETGLAGEAFARAQMLFSRDGETQKALFCKRCIRAADYIMIADKLRLEEERPQEAVHYYELAVEHTLFKFPLALYKLGAALAGSGRYAQAIREYRMALSLRPEYGDARYGLALAYEACGRHGDAEVLLREAVAMNPSWPEAHMTLARCLTRTNRSEAAEEFYRAGTLFLEGKGIGKASEGRLETKNPLESQKGVYRVGDLSVDRDEYRGARLCLKEIKRLSGKSSSIYKRLRRKIYLKELSKIKTVEYH